MTSERLFYADEHDAIAAAVSASGREWKEIACHLWPGMKQASAEAKLRACLNPQGDQSFRLHEVLALMIFCGRFDPLYYLCDETLHARPVQIPAEHQEIKLVETIAAASDTIRRAMAQIEHLQPKKTTRR